MIRIREATDADVQAVREIFVASYGPHYAYPQYYDCGSLRRMVYADDTVLLVAEDDDSKQVLGTASVVLECSAHADLVGEFGRLAVHPDARGRGIGRQLMQGRLDRVQKRLHLGLVENRAVHPYSQMISHRFGFRPLGFIPMKLLVEGREHIALYGRYFGNALKLRRNNPRVIPEVYPLACLAMSNCELPCDCVVDDSAAPFPHSDPFETQELTAEGYASLLRIERGRIQSRDVFGPMKLHYGFFQLQARHSNYLLAKEDGRIAGAIGFTIDRIEKVVRIFELISLSDQPVRFLIERLVEKCRTELGIEYMEVDVNASSPRMQRTLLELDFFPVAYVPAMVFHHVERLDAVKMSRLLVPPDIGPLQLAEATKPFAELVIDSIVSKNVLPGIAEAARHAPLFDGLNDEQISHLIKSCDLATFEPGQRIIREGEADDVMHVILRGEVEVICGPSEHSVGTIGRGQCLGENVLLRFSTHSATAVARTPVESATFRRDATDRLIRRRPDIGVVLYRNLAAGIAGKLARADRRIMGEAW